jgi:hypothetical protein
LKIGALTNESVIDPNFHPNTNEDERLEETVVYNGISLKIKG